MKKKEAFEPYHGVEVHINPNHSNTKLRNAEKEEKSKKLKIKKAMEKGYIDRARICTKNAIQKCIEQMNYLRLASRLNTVVAHLNTQAKMLTINKSMGKLGSVRKRRGERLGEVGFGQVWRG
ncbi:hypothetical protein CMV_004398 [Castanea mollissima]|uniref:Uncharacterized protein n=1 Tax=Castanea mollissima TaxID=60419 RepID=A0A8J4VVK1_9ROSI|nr:hypothetical protein CMV_004398 [Castanea mollissima]